MEENILEKNSISQRGSSKSVSAIRRSQSSQIKNPVSSISRALWLTLGYVIKNIEFSAVRT